MIRQCWTGLSLMQRSILLTEQNMIKHGKRILMQPKNKAHNATAYQFQKGEEILVDANVWLYLFPPPAQPASTWATKYTTAFSVMLKCNAVPIVDTLILSEYCNRYIRIEYEASWAETYRRYKNFRTSADAQAVLGSVVSEMERSLQVLTGPGGEHRHLRGP